MMEPNINQIIGLIERVIAANVISENAYESRFKGFVGELAFPLFAARTWGEIDFFAGGYLVSTVKKARSVCNPVHFNIGTRAHQDLLQVYEKIASLGCQKMFYFEFSDETLVEQWTENGFPDGFVSPPYRIYEYNVTKGRFDLSSIENFRSLFEDKKTVQKPIKIRHEVKSRCRQSISVFSEGALAELYLQRLVFDIIIGSKKIHGIPSDIDFVAYSPKLASFVILEVKEKDLSKKSPQGFGMDVDRMNDFMILQEQTEMPVFYLVRQVKDQTKREFFQWRSIRLDTFRKHVGANIQGGHGMGYRNGKYLTQICPECYFAVLSADTESDANV